MILHLNSNKFSKMKYNLNDWLFLKHIVHAEDATIIATGRRKYIEDSKVMEEFVWPELYWKIGPSVVGRA